MSESKFRKFPKINRLPQEERNQAREHWATLLELIRQGKKFNITEKLDGANAGVEVLKENGKITIHIAAHNHFLNPQQSTLRGFYQFAENNIVPKLLAYLTNVSNCHLYFYGEWLVPHAVRYQSKMLGHWYLFSVYDANSDYEYTLDERTQLAIKTGLRQPPVFFNGVKKDATLNWLGQFVGRSQSTFVPDHGEGVVIECTPVRAKWRVDQFREVQKMRKVRKVHAKNESEQFILDTATPARINKLLYKMIDNNQMPKQIDMKHFGQIVSPLAKSLWDDIMEEEGANLPTNWDAKDARKFLNKQFPQYVRKFINEYTDKKVSKPSDQQK